MTAARGLSKQLPVQLPPRDGATLIPAALARAWELSTAIGEVQRRLAQLIGAAEFDLECGDPLPASFSDQVAELRADFVDRAGQ